MNSIFPDMHPQGGLLKSTVISQWEEFHCYAAQDWGEETVERDHSSKITEKGLKFGCSENVDMFDYGIYNEQKNSEHIEIYDDIYDNAYNFDSNAAIPANSFYHDNESDLKNLAYTVDLQDPWCCFTTLNSQGGETDCCYMPSSIDTLPEEGILNTCLLEEFVPRPSSFVTVKTGEHVVPECDFDLNMSINSDDVPLQEVPEFLGFDQRFDHLPTLNLLSPTDENFDSEYCKNNFESDSCVPVYNPDIMSAPANSLNPDEVYFGSQSTIPDYLLEGSQDIDTSLFEDSSSDEDESVEFDRPMNSCSHGDHTVPRWSIEE